MAYIDTFIQIAPDSHVTVGCIPVSDREPKPIHLIQYELLTQNPYKFTHEDLVFEVYIRRQGFSAEELAIRGDAIRFDLLQKGHPCLRASALTKKYGWGAHYNHEGKIALYPVESETYQHLSAACAKVLKAMRSKR